MNAAERQRVVAEPFASTRPSAWVSEAEEDAYKTYISSLEQLLKEETDAAAPKHIPLNGWLSSPSVATLPPVESIQALGPSSADAVCELPHRLNSSPENSWAQLLLRRSKNMPWDSKNAMHGAEPMQEGCVTQVLPTSNSSWAGHRVNALPSKVVSPITVIVNNFHTSSGQESSLVQMNSCSSIYQLQGFTQPMQTLSADSLLQSSPWSGGQLVQIASSNSTSLPPLDGVVRDSLKGRGGHYGHRGGRTRPGSVTAQLLPSQAPVAVRALKPNWAGSDWDPLKNAQRNACTARSPNSGGTGVFLPGTACGANKTEKGEMISSSCLHGQD